MIKTNLNSLKLPTLPYHLQVNIRSQAYVYGIWTELQNPLYNEKLFETHSLV